MISVLNFKEFNKGAIRGFFDLRYFGLVIKSCRLMSGNNGLWFCFPQVKGEEDGAVKYYDQMFLTSQEREHVRKLVMLELQQQGHIDAAKPEQAQQNYRGPEDQDLSEYSPSDDDIPF